MCARVYASPRIWTTQVQMSEARDEFDDEPGHCLFPESLHHCEGSPPSLGRKGWLEQGRVACSPAQPQQQTHKRPAFVFCSFKVLN